MKIDLAGVIKRIVYMDEKSLITLENEITGEVEHITFYQRLSQNYLGYHAEIQSSEKYKTLEPGGITLKLLEEQTLFIAETKNTTKLKGHYPPL